MSYRNVRGFTTFELLIAVLMLAILLAISVPGVQRSMSSTRLQTAVEELRSELSFARSMAVSRNTTYQVAINRFAGSFQIVDPAASSDEQPRNQRQLESGVKFLMTPTTPITFFPRGHARPGVIFVRNEFGETFRLAVQSSGMVDVTFYRPGK